MYCTKCGAEINDEAVICPNCGCATSNYTPTTNVKEEPNSNGIAVAGFICSFFVPLLGWIFGGVGLARANKRNGKGKGLSIASIVIASIMFFVYAGIYY